MPTKRYLKLDSSKKNVIELAILNEMMRYPFEHINLSNIVSEANISRGSLYKYFNSKNDLYFYMIDEMSKVKRDYIDISIIQATDISFYDKISYMLKQSFLFAKDHPKWLLIAQNLYASKDPSILSFIKDIHLQSKAFYRDLLLSDPLFQSSQTIDAIVNFINESMLFFSQQIYQHPSLKNSYELLETFLLVLKGGLSHV